MKLTAEFYLTDNKDGHNLNGKLMLGENTADLGGVNVALAAFEKSLQGKQKLANIDGFTPNSVSV